MQSFRAPLHSDLTPSYFICTSNTFGYVISKVVP